MKQVLLEVEIQEYAVVAGRRLSVSFQRTRRLSESEHSHMPPTSLGALPVHGVADYRGRVAPEWMDLWGVFLPLLPEEAFWLGFSGAGWKPSAVKVATAGLDAITGMGWSEGLHHDPQDYVVCPPQRSLDGIYAGGKLVRQFVPVESERRAGGQPISSVPAMRIVIFEQKPHLFAKQPPVRIPREPDVFHSPEPLPSRKEIVVSAGAAINQEILPDPQGIEAWDQTASVSLYVYWVDREKYHEITGQKAPGPRSDAEGYTGYRLP